MTVPVDGLPATPGSRRSTAAETAWIVLIPCALLMLAAIVVLGPPLGHALFRPGTDALWPANWWEARGQAEPAKHGSYLLAVLAPFVLAGVILTVTRRPPGLRPRTTRALVLAGQASVIGVVVIAVLGQRRLIFYRPLATGEPRLQDVFSLRDLAVAAALVLLTVLALQSRRLVTASSGWARERPLTRVVGLAIAVVLAATWLTEVPLSDGLAEDSGLLNWVTSGTYAVLDGRTPLVDVHLIYGKLLPYPMALVLTVLGPTTFVFTAFMALLDLMALLAVYAVFRRLVGSVFALMLFLPFVAMSDMRHLMLLSGIWPMRFAGVYLLAWLVARHVDGTTPRRRWIIFFVAGLVTLDTLDFGLAALLASVVALMCARPPRSSRDALRLAGAVASGLLGALAVVTALTLTRTGDLPRLSLLLEWPRIFTRLGWFSMPLPSASLHLALYAALAGAIGVAAVRIARKADDVLLTAMLAWSGVFGLVAANYYVARSDDVKLFAMFAPAMFAVALLTIVCVRALNARDWRMPAPAELLVLYGFALGVCAIASIPRPWVPLSMLRNAPPPIYRSIAEPFLAQHTHRGEQVAILLPESYRIAYDLGLDNIAPYEMGNAIVTRRQMDTLIATIEREHVTRLFTPSTGKRLLGEAETPAEHMEAFREAGFEQIASRQTMLAWERIDPRP